jgi:KaiC/GvpD/RAD55 family RecA-like ATPase
MKAVMPEHVDAAASYAGIPAWLKNEKRWLLWTRVPKLNRKDGKVPYYVSGRPRSGKLDSAEDTVQLAGYEEALAVLASNPGYAGLGIALGLNESGKYLQAIDFDDFVTRPHLWDLALEIPTYAELSPSLIGIRAFGLGERFESLNSNGSGIESWSGRRFATITGTTIKPDDGQGPICLRPFVIDRLRPLHSKTKINSATSPLVEGIVSHSNIFAPGSGLLSDIESALDHISSDERDVWISVGAALVGLGENGYRLWIKWSRRSRKHQPDSDPAIWKSLKGDRTSYQNIFIRARTNGWTDPFSRLVLDRNFVVPENVGPVAPATAPLSTDPKQTGSHDISLPIIRLDNLLTNPPKPPNFIIDRILPRNAVTLLSGHGGSGKSMLALQTAVELIQGYSSLGGVAGSCKVLFYSAEDAADIIRDRVARICNADFTVIDRVIGRLLALDATNEQPLYTEIFESKLRKGSTTPSYDRLVERVEAFRPDLIIIDNASDVYDANENERAKVREFIRALGHIAVRFNAAVLLLAHVDKVTANNQGSNQAFSGSTAWHNSSRSRLFLSSDESGFVKLVHQKSNHGRLAPTVALEWGNTGLLKALPAQDEGAVLAVLLALIHENYERGVFIQPSGSGKNTAHGILHSDSRYPRALEARAAHHLLQSAIRAGRLGIEEYKGLNRHKRLRYRVTAVALSPAYQDSAQRAL